MTAAPPGFILNPVRNRTVGVLQGAKTLGLILHVQAGNGALGGWFNNPKASASSTWWAGKAGGREQYGDPDRDKFWAQAAGNSTYHSIETEGIPSEPLTDAQIESVAVAFAWGHARYGWQLVLAEQPGDPGLGWHGMGGKAWGGHTGCPGDLRKAQRSQILARAKQIAGTPSGDWFDMATQADLEAVVRKVTGIPAGQKALDGADGAYIVKTIAYVRDQLMGQSAAIKDQIAKMNDPAAIAAAIPDNLAQQVVDQLAARLKGA